MKLRDYKRVHCLGIGGIGLSAIARYCLSSGAVVSGTDISGSRITDEFRATGMHVFDSHKDSNITDDIDLVIYTIAVQNDNEELMSARSKGITCLTYPEALGMLTKEYTTIAVCGTHGKTTTTAMIAEMMRDCGLDPTVIVGSLLSNGGTNFIKGDSKYLIIEACEYKRSFLNFSPTYVVVTNIDEDHLDYYKDLNDIKSAFQEFANKIPESGALITHNDVALDTVGQKINADEIDGDGISLSVLGNHNKENAKLALALAKVLNIDDEKAREGLNKFTGTWRRMEYYGETTNGVKVYDDYGHHPTEIKATLQALREAYPKGEYNLNVFFQPHLFSRTRLLLDDFAQSFGDADHVFILPIYHAREKEDGSISHRDLVNKINDLYCHPREGNRFFKLYSTCLNRRTGECGDPGLDFSEVESSKQKAGMVDTEQNSNLDSHLHGNDTMHECKAMASDSLNEAKEKIQSLNGEKTIALTIGAGDVYTELKSIEFKK